MQDEIVRITGPRPIIDELIAEVKSEGALSGSLDLSVEPRPEAGLLDPAELGQVEVVDLALQVGTGVAGAAIWSGLVTIVQRVQDRHAGQLTVTQLSDKAEECEIEEK